jgi:glutamine synthetase
VIGDMANTIIIPSAINYQLKLADNALKLKELGLGEESYSVYLNTAKEISDHVTGLKKLVFEMVEERKIANKIENVEKKAAHYGNKVKPYFSRIRYLADKLERIVENESWQLPKYRELLFIK